MGNNGGTDLFVARKLHSEGAGKGLHPRGPEKIFRRGEGQLQTASALSLEMKAVKSADGIREGNRRSDAIIDAIFGTGLTKGR